MILSEKSATPDQVRGGHFRGHALVPRTRSSHDFSASTFANFGFESGTRIIDLLVSFSIPKFAQRSLRMPANFGIGTLARRRPALARTRLFLPDEIAAFVAGREREAEGEHGYEGGYSCGTGPRACAAASALLFEGHTTRHRPLDQSRTCRTYKSPLRGS